MDASAATPWLTLTEAAAYAKRGKRFLAKEVKSGRLRAAVIGGRRELYLKAEWIDQYLEDLAAPVLAHVRRRA